MDDVVVFGCYNADGRVTLQIIKLTVAFYI
jgi:hypothetical protein